jgi:predicted dehydrogenase
MKSNRRQFLKHAVVGGGGLLAFPTLLPRSVFGANAPSRRIQIAQLGCGRMGRSDMDGVMDHDLGRVVAVCDLDTKRLAAGKKRVEDFYRKQGESAVEVKAYADYRELLARPDIDAVVVSTPDHWHGLMAIEAALAGKHLYVQKPLTYDIAESIALRKAVQAKKVILQTGSQQRSSRPWSSFRSAVEAVRNGRIGKLQTVRVGIGLDQPSGKTPAEMPVPANLDYERWLGPAPQQPYMEGRVHPQDSFSGRPGWITTEDFGLGMITNWGAHHMDIAHWAMGQELGGPKTIEGTCDFMTNDVWTVHHKYHIEMMYPDDVRVILDNSFETGLRFEGSEGWVFCTRSAERVTASDANLPGGAKPPLRASDPKIIAPLGSQAKLLPLSRNHYLNWLECIRDMKEPIAPVDQSARSVQACCAAWIAMKLKRKLTWDVAKEAFVGDDEANALRARKPRKAEYDFNVVMKKAGLA